MINASLKQLSQALAAKQISSVELTQLFLDRINRLNPVLNAFVTFDAEKSLNSAKAADARIAAGTAGLLTGIPIAQKEHDGHFEPVVTDFRVVEKLDAKLFEKP